MDNSKGEQKRKYDFIFEGEKNEDFPKDVAPDLNEVMDGPAKDEPVKDEPVKDVVHEEKFRFDGKVEDNELSNMALEDLGHDLKEEEPPKPVLNDELKEIAEKTPETPVKKDVIMSEPTPEELEAMSIENKFERAAKEVVNNVKEDAHDMQEKVAKSVGNRGNWVYLLIAGLMGMAIGACVIVALVYGGVIGGKVRTEFRDKIIVQECECEECEECDCEEEEASEGNCDADEENCEKEEESQDEKDKGNTTDKANSTETE